MIMHTKKCNKYWILFALLLISSVKTCIAQEDKHVKESRCTWLKQLVITGRHTRFKLLKKIADPKAPLSREDALIRAISTLNPKSVNDALLKKPNPFVCYQDPLWATYLEHNGSFDDSSYMNASRKAIKKMLASYSKPYLKAYLEAVLISTPHDTKQALLTHTHLPTTLIDIITTYIGNRWIYQLPPSVMRCLANNIEHNSIPYISLLLSKVLPYCTDAQGTNLFYYIRACDYLWNRLIGYRVDPLDTPYFNQIFGPGLSENIELQIATNRAYTIRNGYTHSVVDRDAYLLRRALGNATTKTLPYLPEKYREHYKYDLCYQIVEQYLSFNPQLITYHDSNNQSVFEWANATLPLIQETQKRIPRIKAIIGLLLENKADPNMQDKNGNTLLHRIALDSTLFNEWPYASPAESPFMQVCGPLLNLTITNSDSLSVLEVIEKKVTDFDKYTKNNYVCEAYRNFSMTLSALSKRSS